MRKSLTLIALALALPGVARGQVADAALKDRVAQLVERLGSMSEETRKGAEESLLKLGPRVLPLLPDPGKAGVPAREERLAKVREALRDAADRTSLEPSKVTIRGQGIRLSEALRQLQSQSGNVITDLREAEGGEAPNPALDLDIDGLPFYEALDRIAAKAELTPYFYSGDGSVSVMAGAPPKDARIQYSGPFRIAFRQLGVLRDFQAGASTANAQFDVAWEPRLRPMLLKLKLDEIAVVDDRGQKVEPQVMDESGDLPLRPETPAVELNLNLAAPDRAAQKLASLKVKADVTVPSGLRLFRFPDLAKRGTTVAQGDIRVTLESAEVDEQVWKVNVEVAYPGGGPAFESYRQGLFNNRLWLQKPDGSRFEHNGGFSNTASDGGKLGFEYLFVDVPGKFADYAFVYETPSQVLTLPFEFEFKDVPLP